MRCKLNWTKLRRSGRLCKLFWIWRMHLAGLNKARLKKITFSRKMFWAAWLNTFSLSSHRFSFANTYQKILSKNKTLTNLEEKSCKMSSKRLKCRQVLKSRNSQSKISCSKHRKQKLVFSNLLCKCANLSDTKS